MLLRITDPSICRSKSLPEQTSQYSVGAVVGAALDDGANVGGGDGAGDDDGDGVGSRAKAQVSSSRQKL